MISQDIPNQLKDKTSSEVIASFFTPPIGALIAAMVSTFGIYLVASLLYVRVAISSLLAFPDSRNGLA